MPTPSGQPTKAELKAEKEAAEQELEALRAQLAEKESAPVVEADPDSELAKIRAALAAEVEAREAAEAREAEAREEFRLAEEAAKANPAGDDSAALAEAQAALEEERMNRRLAEQRANELQKMSGSVLVNKQLPPGDGPIELRIAPLAGDDSRQQRTIHVRHKGSTCRMSQKNRRVEGWIFREELQETYTTTDRALAEYLLRYSDVEVLNREEANA